MATGFLALYKWMAECGCRWFYIALTVVGVVIILLFFRHGHRSPLHSFPTDKYPYNNSQFWPQGPGELTKQGMREMFQLGKLLRMRYLGLFRRGYRQDLVKAYGTHSPRTHTSCQLVLAGMFPAKYDKWSNEISWQPIPVWTSEVAYVKFKQEETCPKFNAEFIRETTEGQKFLKGENETTYAYLRKHSGLPMTQLCNVYLIWDTFNSQLAQGYKLPDWSKYVYPETLTKLMTECYKIQCIKSPLQLQLGASPWMIELMNHLKSNSSTVFFINSGHDFILTFLLSALGYDMVMPHPSGTITIELHKIEMDFTVKFFYYEDISVINPKQLDMPNCRNPCHLKQLEQFVNNFVPQDYNEACKI